MTDQLCLRSAACYGLPVVRGSPNPLHFRLPLRLRQARRKSDLSSAAVAQSAGISHAVVRYIETDQRIPTAETVARLARALETSPAWVAYGLGPQSNDGVAASCDGMAERLHSARTERGHTRIELGRIAKLNPGSIAKIEAGGQAGVDTLEQLAKALRISPAWLAFGAGPMELPARRRSRQNALSAADA